MSYYRVRNNRPFRKRRGKQINSILVIAAVVILLAYYQYETQGITKTITGLFVQLEAANNAQAKDSFKHINEIRNENGVAEIEWDERIYELALYKANDMYKRAYFDHPDRDGLCIGSYAKQFGLDYPGDTFADNIFSGGTYSLAISSWMDSRGHRYNLLFPEHQRGAVACAWDNCVFIGQGSSGWVCDTGDNGLAYWETASS